MRALKRALVRGTGCGVQTGVVVRCMMCTIRQGCRCCSMAFVVVRATQHFPAPLLRLKKQNTKTMNAGRRRRVKHLIALAEPCGCCFRECG